MTKKANEKENKTQNNDAMPTLPMQIKAQYIKDLSFENPNPLEIMSSGMSQPDLDINIDVGANKIDERNFEVILNVQAKATATEDKKVAFIVEVSYAGLFELAKEVPEEHFGPLLLIEAPRMLFPFVRSIVSDATRDGGYPPLALAPIDFAALYVKQLQEQQGAEKETKKADKKK